MAAGSAAARRSSSWLTSMRSAWNVRLAGLPRARCRHRLLDDRGQLGARLDPRPAARLDDPAGDPSGESLLAVLAQDARETLLVLVGEDVRRGARARAVHTHVERRVVRIREAPRGVVDLQRGDTEVHEDALDPA